MTNGIIPKIIKSSKYFVLVYVLFLVGVVYLLMNFSRLEGTVLVNQTWTPVQDVFFKYCTYLGGGETAIIVVCLLLLFSGVRNGVIALVSFGVTAGATQFLKRIVFPEVMRPYIALWDEFKEGELHLVLSEELMKKGHSFPSGHTTSAFSVFLILTLFAKRPRLGIVFASIAVLASYSRVYLSQHFFEDIFVGSMIGVFGTFVVYFLFEKTGWLKGVEQPLIKLKKQ
ncbi:MAG: phosphatase PAP2 family protein [Flavobacteriales bacterium]|jgi:membrane-associated phospholipid phosphatase|nr:phosphatase PAP2 family protein [Flavobacteriales bacterium]